MIEKEFQTLLQYAYGAKMLTKDQTESLRRFFIAGIAKGYRLTLEAAEQSTENGELIIALATEVRKAFKEAFKK